MAGQLARPHPPTCSGLCLEAGTLASPSRKRRMSGSACCWGSACPTPPLCSPGSWVNPGYTCPPSPGGRCRILACPSPPVGLPCGARSHSGCGPGPARPRTPGQEASLVPKVWACLSPRAWEVCVVDRPCLRASYCCKLSKAWWPSPEAGVLAFAAPVAGPCFLLPFMQSSVEYCWGHSFLTPSVRAYCAWSSFLVGNRTQAFS